MAVNTSGEDLLVELVLGGIREGEDVTDPGLFHT